LDALPRRLWVALTVDADRLRLCDRLNRPNFSNDCDRLNLQSLLTSCLAQSKNLRPHWP
jgi:hypothetical protein